MSLVNWF